MVEALKRIDKKILIIASLIIFLPIILIIFLVIFQGCSNSKLTPEEYEQKMISATEKYIEGKEPKEEGEVVTVKLSKLVKEEYIKPSEQVLDDDSCNGYVTVRRNGSSIEENNGGYLNYTVNLECDNYKTNTLTTYLLKQLVTTGNGLYKQGDNYIFKGDDVDNYINFFDSEYRILSMNSDGILKLIKVERGAMKEYWDSKYNTEINEYYGKNIYADSSILKKLLTEYNDPKTISNSAKKHIVAQDICIDSRYIADTTMNNDKKCTKILENQVISLIDVVDYANASLDLECKSIDSLACNNYNYLQDISLSTWTLNSVADNSYEVYYLGSGIVRNQKASKYDFYNAVIYVDGNEKVSGEGKKDNPYTLK